MRRLAKVMAAVGVGLAVGVPLAMGGSDGLKNLCGVTPQIFFILASLSIVSGVAKAGKLQILLNGLGHHLPFLRTLAVAFATDLAFLSSPAGVAGYVTNIALLRDARTPWATSTAVVGADQALDFVFFAIAIPLSAGLALVPLGHAVSFAAGWLYLLLPTILVVTGGIWCSRRFLATTLHRYLDGQSWFQTKKKRIDTFFNDLRQQVTTLVKGSAKQYMGLLLLTCLQWVSRYGVLWLVLQQLGYTMSFGFVLLTQVVILHLAQWTGIPAGGGSADLGLAAAFATWVPSTPMATVLLLWRFSTLYFPLLIGGLGLAFLTLLWKSTSEPSDSDNPLPR